MVNKCKTIVLLIGLENIKDYEFRLIKSLLAKDLKLTKNMQDDYDRIRIADLMEEKFPRDAGLSKLITLCKQIPALADLAETLQKQRLKVKGKPKGGKKPTLKKGQQDEPTTDHSTSTTNTDSEPETKEEIPLLKHQKGKTTFAKKKGKVKVFQEKKVKKSEDPGRMQPPPEQSQFRKPSATSKEQTEGCPQTPHGPPPTPFSSPPVKRPKVKKSASLVNMQEKISSSLQKGQEMEATNRKTNKMKVQLSQGQHQLPELSEIDIKPSQCVIHTPQMPSTSPPQMPPTAPSSSLQTPQMPPTAPSSSLQTPQMPPTAPSSSLQTPQMPPTAPSSSLHTPQMPPTAPSGKIHTPHLSLISPREFQTPHLSLTSSSRVQTPYMFPTNPSGRIKTPHFSPTSSRGIQSSHLSPTSFSKIQTPHISPMSSNSLQTPQMPPTAPSGKTHTPHLSLTSPREFQTPHLSPTSSSKVQTPHMSPTNPSGRIKTPHFSPASSREIQRPHLCPTTSSRIQTLHIFTTSSSSLQTPQMPPTEPSNTIQNPQVCPATPSTSLQAPQKTTTSFSSCLPMNPRLTTIPKEASEECGHQKGPKEVKVLKATEPFTYFFNECWKKMFHATVATESEFFRVKVFDVNVKDKFIPKKVIAISDYIGRNGFLEIYSASSVSDVSANRKMEIPKLLLKNANETPTIEYLCSRSTMKYVSGVYRVYKKTVREDCTYYEIRDDTGRMEVMVYGRLTYINCEEGDKLNLFCFELAFNADKWQLRSVCHSYIKVTKATKSKTCPLNCDSNMDT